MYIVKITNNTPLCKMVNFSRSVLKIYTGQKKFTRAAPVAPVTNIRYAYIHSNLSSLYYWCYSEYCIVEQKLCQDQFLMSGFSDIIGRVRLILCLLF